VPSVPAAPSPLHPETASASAIIALSKNRITKELLFIMPLSPYLHPTMDLPNVKACLYNLYKSKGCR
jgi:hypothetical protein